jgi:hypothetical protein
MLPWSSSCGTSHDRKLKRRKKDLFGRLLTRARGDTIRECRLSTLEIMAKALGVNIVDLFEEREDK